MSPDSAIYFTLGNFLKPVATIILPKSPIFLGNFGEGGKIFHYSTEIIYWAAFYWSPCSWALILGSQQLAGPQHVVIQPQQEVTR